MLADYYRSNKKIYGKVIKDDLKDSTIEAVINYINKNLSDFSRQYSGNDLPEKTLNHRLSLHLQRSIGFEPFIFQTDHPEIPGSGQSPSVDLGVYNESPIIQVKDQTYNQDDCFFSLEAKRLPNPTFKKEYVIGKDKVSGGIERFKKCIHGNKLYYAGIVGYIQKEDFDYWFDKINYWLKGLANKGDKILWSEDDLLSWVDKSYEPTNVSLFSNNERQESCPRRNIKIYHFWINLCDN